MNIHHIAIWTRNLELEKEFFLKYFDCQANMMYRNQQKGFSSYFISFSDGCRIELMKRDDIRLKGNQDAFGLAHFAIDMGNERAVIDLTVRLENDGFVVEDKPRTTGDGYFESVVLDPEGNRIELIAKK
jgi:lactoylglutathione lyase